MAWYEMEYSCGHSERVQLYGPNKERQRTLEWAKHNKLCPKCWADKKEQERKQENDRAASLQTEIGLLPLQGSEKQVAWATSIRQKIYENYCKRFQPHPKHGYSLFVRVINAETSAKWWIDNRNRSDEEIGNMIAGSHPALMEEIEKIAED